jgi:hypothetical protein
VNRRHQPQADERRRPHFRWDPITLAAQLTAKYNLV